MSAPCEKCGYDLRTLRPDRKCPECGHSIEASLLTQAQREERLPKRARDAIMESLRGMATCIAATFILLAWVIPQASEPLSAMDTRFGTGLGILMLVPMYRWLLWRRVERALGATNLHLAMWSAMAVTVTLIIAGLLASGLSDIRGFDVWATAIWVGSLSIVWNFYSALTW